MSSAKLRIPLGFSRALKNLVQFNNTFTMYTCNLQVRPLHLQVQMKTSSTKIVTNPAGSQVSDL